MGIINVLKLLVVQKILVIILEKKIYALMNVKKMILINIHIKEFALKDAQKILKKKILYAYLII